MRVTVVDADGVPTGEVFGHGTDVALLCREWVTIPSISSAAAARAALKHIARIRAMRAVSAAYDAAPPQPRPSCGGLPALALL